MLRNPRFSNRSHGYQKKTLLGNWLCWGLRLQLPSHQRASHLHRLPRAKAGPHAPPGASRLPAGGAWCRNTPWSRGPGVGSRPPGQSSALLPHQSGEAEPTHWSCWTVPGGPRGGAEVPHLRERTWSPESVRNWPHQPWQSRDPTRRSFSGAHRLNRWASQSPGTPGPFRASQGQKHFLNNTRTSLTFPPTLGRRRRRFPEAARGAATPSPHG